MLVYGYVVMPEHVHLLVGEPDKRGLARAIQSLKQSVARKLALRAADPFWQARYYDFKVWSERKFVEKLRYIHRNPLTRGLVTQPEDWRWSSFRHYAIGKLTPIEIESHWTARAREHRGIFLTVPPQNGASGPKPFVRNTLRISSLNSKILRERLPNPLIPQDEGEGIPLASEFPLATSTRTSRNASGVRSGVKEGIAGSEARKIQSTTPLFLADFAAFLRDLCD